MIKWRPRPKNASSALVSMECTANRANGESEVSRSTLVNPEALMPFWQSDQSEDKVNKHKPHEVDNCQMTKY